MTDNREIERKKVEKNRGREEKKLRLPYDVCPFVLLMRCRVSSRRGKVRGVGAAVPLRRHTDTLESSSVNNTDEAILTHRG